ARAFVPLVGVQAYAEYMPLLERICEHEELRLGVRRGADRRAGEPGVTDLTRVGSGPAAGRVTRRPRPAPEPEKAAGAEHRTRGLADGGERQGGAGVAPGDGLGDVVRDLLGASRHRAPLVEIALGCRCGREAAGVARVEGLETNVATDERGAWHARSIIHAASPARRTNHARTRRRAP